MSFNILSSSNLIIILHLKSQSTVHDGLKEKAA